MQKKCQDIEKKYIEMFSNKIETHFGYIFEDSNQRDKHMHNLLFVERNSITPKDIDHYLDSTEQFGFSNIRFDQMDIPKHINRRLYKIETYGYYMASLDAITISSRQPVHIQKVDCYKDDAFYTFIFDDDKQFGLDYAKNNHVRLKQVLINNQERYHFYKLVVDHHIIGHINVFYDQEIAKIDEFYILESYQRQGYGITMLSQLLDIIKARNIQYVYLITSESETAKYLYRSIGLQSIGYYYELKIKTLDVWD